MLDSCSHIIPGVHSTTVDEMDNVYWREQAAVGIVKQVADTGSIDFSADKGCRILWQIVNLHRIVF